MVEIGDLCENEQSLRQKSESTNDKSSSQNKDTMGPFVCVCVLINFVVYTLYTVYTIQRTDRIRVDTHKLPCK